MRVLRVIGVGAAIIAAGICSSSAQNTITFAQFQQGLSAPANPFTFTNAGASSSFFVSGSIPVNFTYQVPNGYGAPPGTPIAAMMTFHSLVSGTASQVLVGSKFVDFQKMEAINMVFTAVVPVGGMNLLLSVVNSNDVLSGFDRGHTASLSADTSVGNTVNYQSDFLSNLGNAQSRNFELSFSSVVPIVGIAPNHYFRSFTASGTGTFAEVVPESAAIVLLAAGSIPLTISVVRRRRKRVTVTT